MTRRWRSGAPRRSWRRRWLAPGERGGARPARSGGDRAGARRGVARPGQRRRTARCAAVARLPERGGSAGRARMGRLAGGAGARQPGDAAADAARSTLWVAAERLAQFQALWPEARRAARRSCCQPTCAARMVARRGAGGNPARPAGRLGPVTPAALAAPLGLEPDEIAAALVALEVEGFALRGRFTPGTNAEEWCDRRLLARIHHYTVRRLRAEIEPVAARDFLRFLFAWQRVTDETRLEGPDAVAAAVALLEGFEAPAGAWETELLPARIADYEPAWLDDQCLAGRVAWARLTPVAPRATAASAPRRRCAPRRSRCWRGVTRSSGPRWRDRRTARQPSGRAQAVLDCLRAHGASFFDELVGGDRPVAPAGGGGARRTGGARAGELGQFRRAARAAGAVRSAQAVRRRDRGGGAR